MTTPVYNVDYFIAKFEAIPEEQIGRGSIQSRCANWHCGARDYNDSDKTPEVKALAGIVESLVESTAANEFERIFYLNDGLFGAHRFGTTPRARILAALREIKSKEAK